MDENGSTAESGQEHEEELHIDTRNYVDVLTDKITDRPFRTRSKDPMGSLTHGVDKQATAGHAPAPVSSQATRHTWSRDPCRIIFSSMISQSIHGSLTSYGSELTGAKWDILKLQRGFTDT